MTHEVFKPDPHNRPGDSALPLSQGLFTKQTHILVNTEFENISTYYGFQTGINGCTIVENTLCLGSSPLGPSKLRLWPVRPIADPVNDSEIALDFGDAASPYHHNLE